MTHDTTDDQNTVNRYLEDQWHEARENGDSKQIAVLAAVLNAFDRITDAINYQGADDD